jgi:predicted transposase YdaD
VRPEVNMLLTEWNWDDALDVRFEEGREDEREKIAKNMKAHGRPLEEISEDTGLDMETIKNL